MMEDFVAIDFETTDYRDGRANEPWQLGYVRVARGAVVEKREWFFRTKAKYFPETPPSDFPAPGGDTSLLPENFLEQWEDLFGSLFGRRLLAHNLACEKTLLTRYAPLTKWGPWTDTLKVVRARYPDLASYKLGDLCAFFGCVPEMEDRTWHDGLFDALACALLALKLKV